MTINLKIYVTTITLFIGIFAFGQSHSKKDSEIAFYLDNLDQDDFWEQSWLPIMTK